MRRLDIDYAVVATAIISLLLIAYVFAGGARRRPDPEVRCSSAQALDQIKRELFRRASVIRGTDEPGFAQVADHAVVRAASRVLREREKGGAVNCSASIALDLPPGVEVIGGRRTLAAKVRYIFAAGANGTPQLRTLNDADAIVQPLATVSQAGRQPGGPLIPPAPTSQANAAEQAGASLPGLIPVEPAPAQRTRPPAEPSRTATAPAAPRAVASPTPVRLKARAPSPARAVEPRPAPRRASTVQPRAAPKPLRRTITASATAPPTARPSFSCRSARTRGELAVCRNPDLANLDRQMSQQFYRSLSVASPGAKQLLQRSRNRFLKNRDSCGSDQCVASAYEERMGEISEIMGRF